MSTKFESGHLKEREDLGIYWTIELKLILEKWLDVGWIHLAQDRDK
jgi:hypothetical protein